MCSIIGTKIVEPFHNMGKKSQNGMLNHKISTKVLDIMDDWTPAWSHPMIPALIWLGTACSITQPEPSHQLEHLLWRWFPYYTFEFSSQILLEVSFKISNPARKLTWNRFQELWITEVEQFWLCLRRILMCSCTKRSFWPLMGEGKILQLLKSSKHEHFRWFPKNSGKKFLLKNFSFNS